MFSTGSTEVRHRRRGRRENLLEDLTEERFLLQDYSNMMRADTLG
jgi:hypothetical protein